MRIRSWMTVALLGVASCANCPCNRTDTACAADTDCQSGELCQDDVCVVRRACQIDDECETGLACIGNYCQAGPRRTDAGPPDGGVAECQFGDQQCQDGFQLRVCAVGFWTTVDCRRNGLVCANNGCEPAPCTSTTDAGRCIDLATVQSCSDQSLTDCAADEICWNGACAKATGEPCTDDPECAGGYCHCKNGTCAGTSLANGYCSQIDCNTDGGNACPLTDECMGLASAGAGAPNICGIKASFDCPDDAQGQANGYTGPFKRYMPIPDPTNPERYTYGDPVCFDGFPRPVGAGCAGPTDCIGGASVGYVGQCLVFGGQVPSGYCTHACDQTHPCPPGAACANRPGTDPAGAGVCVLMCGEQKVGLAECNRANVTCKPTGSGFNVLDGRTDSQGYCWGP